MVKHSHDFAPGEQPALENYLPGLRPPLEAQLIDPADEIAYNTADLDDAFSAGLLTAADAAQDVPQYAAIHAATQTRFPGATEREHFHETLRCLIDTLVSGLIEGTESASAAAGVSDCDAVRRWPARLAVFTPVTAAASRQLKSLLYRRVYASPALADDRQRSMERIGRLFRFYVDRPDRLPQPYCEQARTEPVHRVVCDYIAGMTDVFFSRTYEQMIG
jgi:dGTPase